MRVFGHKLFENTYQRQLTDGSDYGKKQDPVTLADQLMKMSPSDAPRFVAAMHMWHHQFTEGFSIADVVAVLEHASASRPFQDPYGNGAENIDAVLRGGELMIAGLIRRANQLAAGVHSGAALAGAFGQQ